MTTSKEALRALQVATRLRPRFLNRLRNQQTQVAPLKSSKAMGQCVLEKPFPQAYGASLTGFWWHQQNVEKESMSANFTPTRRLFNNFRTGRDRKGVRRLFFLFCFCMCLLWISVAFSLPKFPFYGSFCQPPAKGSA